MSETTGTPAPPPAVPAFDFAKPFTFVFEDPAWVSKVLVGGIFVLLAFIIVGWFFLLGYAARLTRNVVSGAQHPLPEWDDLGTYFSEGIQLALIPIAYIIPLVLLAMLVVVPAAIAGDSQSELLANVGGCLIGSVWCLVVPLSFAVTLFLPAALLLAIMENRIGAGFEFKRIWVFIKANVANYLLAIVVYLVARFAAGFGIALLCIGVLFTEFWALMVTAYAMAQVYRLAATR
jgi:hypothetical protein